MTLEKLLGMSANELESMTEAQLKEYFSPYLKYTRPELAAQQQQKIKSNFSPKQNERKQVMNMLKLFESKFGEKAKA